MPPRLPLRPTLLRHILRPAPAASSRCARPLLPVAQQSSHTRGLRTSQALHIEELFGLLTTFFESPPVPETTILESSGGGHPEHAAFCLSGLARAVQNSRKRSPTITTLSPERLTPADIIHLPRDAQTVTVSFKPLLELSSTIGASTITSIAPATPAARPSPTPGATTPPGCVPRATHASTAHTAPHPRVPHEVTLRAASGASDLEGVQFPAGLACLYYHTLAAPCTPLAGALRLRILPAPAIDLGTWTDQGVRGAFARGHDFCVRAGMPWHVPLLTLAPIPEARSNTYGAVRAMLLHEQLVAQSVMSDAEREGRQWNLKRHGSRVIHGFGQPFVVDLSAATARFYFVGQEVVHQHTVRNLCSWNLLDPSADEEHQPFIGRLMCAFERSKDPKDVGKPFVMIRVLEILSPVHRNPRYSGPQDIPLPRPGKLLARGIRRRAPHMWRRGWMLWRANVATVFRGMRVLFENDPEGMPGEKSGRK